MIAFFALALSAAAPAPVDHPKTYLASIADIPLKPDERIEGFSISTWGVTFTSVCQIPLGWTIRAGGSATPDGVLEGEASLGATRLSGASPRPLHDLVLLTLYDTVQRRDVRSSGGAVEIPATFKGWVHLSGADTDRRARLNYANVRLKPASRCPVTEQ